MNCPTCGTSNAQDAVFCTQCATNITGQGTGVRYNPHAHAPLPPAPYGGYGGYGLPSRSSTILTLGILSLVVCSIMGPIAWAMGSEELRRIEAGTSDPHHRGTVVAGRICGIVATCLMIFSVLMLIFLFASIASETHHYSNHYNNY